MQRVMTRALIALGLMAAPAAGWAMEGTAYLLQWQKYFDGSISGQLDDVCRGTDEIVSLDVSIIGEEKFVNCEEYKDWRRETQNSTCTTNGRSGRVQLELGVDVETFRDPAHATGRISKPAGKYLETVNFDFSLKSGGNSARRALGEAKGAMIWRCNTSIGRGDFWNCKTGEREKGVVELAFGLNNRDEKRSELGVSHYTGQTGDLFFMEVSEAEKRQSPFVFGFDDGASQASWKSRDNARLVGAWRCISQ